MTGAPTTNFRRICGFSCPIQKTGIGKRQDPAKIGDLSEITWWRAHGD